MSVISAWNNRPRSERTEECIVIQENLTNINNRIFAAEKKSGYSAGSVKLIAVSKKQSHEKIREAFLAGQTAFAENYAQEAIAKQLLLHDLKIEWHFIGTIQSNKTKLIATHFDWVHSVSRFEIAEKLNRHREIKEPLNICIEVNVDGEPSKSGVAPEDVLPLAKKIMLLKNLRLRGLMVIPEKNSAHAFEKTAAVQKKLMQAGLLLDTLSMGMSDDFEKAIRAGSTLVRIGTAIFGERE